MGPNDVEDYHSQHLAYYESRPFFEIWCQDYYMQVVGGWSIKNI